MLNPNVKISLIILCFSLMTLPGLVMAEEVLTWNDCLREAAKQQPDLISAEEQLKQVVLDKSVTKNAALPQINSELSGKTSKTAGQDEVDSYAYSVTGKQLLFDGFKTSHDIGAASENIKAAQYDYAVTSSNVRLNLKTAFVGLLRAQELVSITTDISTRREQNLQLVKLRYEAGTEHEGSLLTAEADFAQADFEVTQAQRNLALTQRQLTTELGREEFTPIKVVGDFEISNIDKERPDFEYLADNTPFLRELIAKKESARLGLKSAKADFFPQIYLNGSMGKSDSHWPPDENQWSAGVSVSFPIFEGGSRIAKVSKAESELNQAEADERSGRDSVLFTLEEAWTAFQDAVDKIFVQRKYLKAAETRAKIANAEYSTGLISFDDWIIIEDNLVATKKSFLDSRANMLVSEANWIQAKGGILEYEK